MWHEAEAILTTAADENRENTAEELGKWEGLMGEIDRLDARMRGVLDAEQRARDTDAAFDAVGRRPVHPAAAAASSDGRDLNSELRAFLKGEPGAPRVMHITHKPEIGRA